MTDFRSAINFFHSFVVVIDLCDWVEKYSFIYVRNHRIFFDEIIFLCVLWLCRKLVCLNFCALIESTLIIWYKTSNESKLKRNKKLICIRPTIVDHRRTTSITTTKSDRKSVQNDYSEKHTHTIITIIEINRKIVDRLLDFLYAECHGMQRDGNRSRSVSVQCTSQM